MKPLEINVIGAGLAGSEAALVLADQGLRVRLYDQKPVKFSAVHKLQGPAELVCSNSFKSTELTGAAGLLKAELKELGSPLIAAAEATRVPGGKALAVDREAFSEKVQSLIESHPQIEFIHEEVTRIPEGPTLIASGPLTSDALISDVLSLCEDEGLYFYDATSPVVTLESLDMDHFFWASRNQNGDDYLNLPLSHEEYLAFREAILSAEKMPGHHPEEDLKFFEGCLPIEVLASRGEDVLACSCMKPSGFGRRSNRKTYAIIQFRRERAAGDLLSMVGFQTRMKWPEQERVFRSLPGMSQAQFVRLGVMHRNTFINAPLHLTDQLSHKKRHDLFFAGQITGSEGYTEAIASGHYAALHTLKMPQLPETTAIRSLIRFLINSDPAHYQPMNFNFGLLPPIHVERSSPKPQHMSMKQFVNLCRSERALKDLRAWKLTSLAQDIPRVSAS